MKAFFADLAESFKSHHDMDRPVLQWIGIFGFFAWPLFYMLRRMLAPEMVVYDDLQLRLIAACSCLVLGLRSWWPEKLKPYYLAYSYATILYCLAYLMAFVMLKNGGGTSPVANMLMGAILIILLSDWRNAIVILLVGHVGALAVYWQLDPQPRLPAHFLVSTVGAVLIVAAGAFANISQKRAEMERIRNLYAGLGGSIAHEMRHPLSQLRHMLDSLAAVVPNAAPGRSATISAEHLAKINVLLSRGSESVTRGLQAIDVTLKQLSPSALDPDKFTLIHAGDAARKAVNEFAYDSEAHRSKVSVRVIEDFAFKGEPTAFMLVFFNLIKNALYYAPLKPHISVTLTIECGRISVRDTGPGISPEVLPRLFREFQTVGKAGGTGLGLSFCQRVVHALGGSITCRSEYGAFTEFELALNPVGEDEVAEFAQQVEREARAYVEGARALVVDDDSLARRVTAARLMQLGALQVDEASTGREALQILRTAKYRLVVMDIHMPELDGYATTLLIREGHAQGNEDILVLGHSSTRESEASVYGRRAGMNGFLSKGSGSLEFAQAITALFGAAHQAAGAFSWSGRSVLLVDDNDSNRTIVAATLSDLGMEVLEAAHGRAALAMLEAGARPDVVLMDVNMPGLDGIATTRLVRAMPGGAGGIPIFALTGNSSHLQVERGLEAGVNAFLTKPLDLAVLRAELSKAMVPAGLPQRSGRGEPQQPGYQVSPLLNAERINEFRRLRILDQLLPSCRAEIRAAFQRLERDVSSTDLKGALQSIHSLLGISGEAGAIALHVVVKSFHSSLINGQWPQQNDWLAQLRDLVDTTEAAVRALEAEEGVVAPTA